jgi:predicted NUDIX family phosphoesterase
MEFVYVVKRYDLFERSFPHGLDLLDLEERVSLEQRIREHGFFVERRHAELDSSFKQVIPYCLVVRGGQVFVMRRLSGGGEARLHGKRSVGVGGHINPVDGLGAGDDIVAEGLRREVSEELHIDGPWDVHTVGLLNDDSTDVGSVHVGLVGIVTTDADVRVRETETLEGEFVSVDQLRRLLVDERETFETWSALVLDRMDAILAG